jgi:hypothetical protein
MSSAEYAYRLSLTLAGPLVSAGLEARALGVDVSQLRDHRGRIVLPGTLVRGMAKQVLREIADDPTSPLDKQTVERWFGRESANAQRPPFAPDACPWEPQRGYIRFDDLRTDSDAGRDSAATTRIAVDAATGSVKRGHLLVVEMPFGFGERVTFEGDIRIRSDCPDRAQLVQMLSAALKLIPALGAFKTAGFGRVVDVQLGEAGAPAGEQAAASDVELLPDADHIDLVLEFEDPFLVFSRGLGGNLFESADFVPGGVIKAAFAEKLRSLGRYSDFESVLASVVIRHALPEKVEPGDAVRRRARAIPLSAYVIYLTEREHYDDLIDPAAEVSSLGLVEFAPDWKETPEEVTRHRWRNTKCRD